VPYSHNLTLWPSDRLTGSKKFAVVRIDWRP
jgi:hypothetical protein